MRDVVVVMKDGRKACGPLWTWRPEDGWFDLVLPDDDPLSGPIRLADVASAVNKKAWVRHDEVRDVDLLERAREEGWDGR